MNQNGNGRVLNNSSQPLLVGVRAGERWVYYRLLPNGRSPSEDAPVIVRAATPGVNIRGAAGWRLEGPVVAYIMDSGDALSIACSACTKLESDEIPTGQLASRRENERWQVRAGDVWVTILGAGITGLSAAHELVARGIRVQVIEKNHQSPLNPKPGAGGAPSRAHEPESLKLRIGLDSPDVGGIARTQWSTIPQKRLERPITLVSRRERPSALNPVHTADWYGETTTVNEDDRDLRIPFAGNKLLPELFAERFKRWFDKLRESDRSVVGVQLVAIVYSVAGSEQPEVCGTAAAYARVGEFQSWFDLAGADAQRVKSALNCLEPFPVARLELTVDEAPKADEFAGLLMRHHEHLELIPGEHGFRFFPGFYRHLRDTMKRTPILDDTGRYATSRSVHDNLTQVRWQVIVDPQRQHAAAFARRAFPSTGALFEQYRSLRQDLGYRPSDMMRFLLRLGRYMTSSTERRMQHYEKLSWWDFLSVRDLRSYPVSPTQLAEVERVPYGTRFGGALRHSPLALVAMKAETCDARTQGNISVQLGMSQFNLHEYTDSALNGPTSDSWFWHWRRYLEAQGVRFFVGEVTSISTRAARDGDEEDLSPTRSVVDVEFPAGEPPEDYVDIEAIVNDGFGEDAPDAPSLRHYYLCALDVVGLERTTRTLRSRPGLTYRGVLSQLSNFLVDADQIQDIQRIGKGELSRFQTLTGIQFYYQPQISFADGHIYFAESPWGLSGVSQVQYWGSGGDGQRSDLLSNLSIDIGSWFPGGASKETYTPDPNQLSRDSIASEVMAQLAGKPWQASHADHSDYFHLDDYIQFCFSPEDRELRPRWNRAPFLVNLVSEWQLRPAGDPWAPTTHGERDRIPGRGGYLTRGRDGAARFVRSSETTPVWRHENGGYLIHYDNLVFAGTHMRTFTRMGTMEAANESARHAVNAVLDHLVFCEPKDTVQLGVELDSPSSGAYKMPTKFGDYCAIWDPEQMEIPDLDFLRVVDKHLMAAGDAKRAQADDVAPGSPERVAPHLFDLLRVDELPDLMDGDGDALRIFELIESGFKTFAELGRHDVPSALSIVDELRRKVEALMSNLARSSRA